MSLDSERRRLKSKRTRERNALAEQIEDGPPFHIDRYQEAVPWLMRPPMPEMVQFRVWEWWDGPNGRRARVVPFIDVRTVYLILNRVCPELWTEDPVTTVGGAHFHTLRFFGHADKPDTTHIDVGDYAGKGKRSDGIKRAATHAGIGDCLYYFPPTELDEGGEDARTGYLMDGRERGDDGQWKPALLLTREGEEYARDIYRRWLLAYGIAAFGRPLDYGNLTAPSEMEITGPPMPTGRERKASPERTRERRPAASTATHATGGNVDTITPDATPEDKLDVLLNKVTEDGLQVVRVQCNTLAIAHGFDPEQRLKMLLDAADKRGLDALLTRLSNVPSRDDTPIEDGGNTE